MWTWGDSSWGQCGTGSFAFSCTPARVKSLNGKRITAVACGYAHTLALSSGGEVYAWGINSSHQVGRWVRLRLVLVGIEEQGHHELF